MRGWTHCGAMTSGVGMFKGIKGILFYTAGVFTVSLAYFLYAYTAYPPTPERESFFAEIGEGFGEAGLWVLLFIYARTLLKLVFGKGAIARRLLPDVTPLPEAPGLQRLLGLLDRTHIYVGIAAVALIGLHVALVGLPMHILFFPVVLVLVAWQGLFGLFLSWRYSPRQLRKFAYLVHAQFFTGIMIGVFAWFGHLLIDS